MLPKPTSGLTCCAIVAPALLGRDVPTGGFGGENSNRPIGHDALDVFPFTDSRRLKGGYPEDRKEWKREKAKDRAKKSA